MFSGRTCLMGCVLFLRNLQETYKKQLTNSAISCIILTVTEIMLT